MGVQLTEERLLNLKFQVDLLSKTEKDHKFIGFINCLSDEELEAFFYIDAQRADCFLRDLTSTQGSETGISDLMVNKESIQGCSSYKDIAIENLIQYWKRFSFVPKPVKRTRETLIEKHIKYYRELTHDEIDFFSTC